MGWGGEALVGWGGGGDKWEGREGRVKGGVGEGQWCAEGVRGGRVEKSF